MLKHNQLGCTDFCHILYPRSFDSFNCFIWVSYLEKLTTCFLRVVKNVTVEMLWKLFEDAL